MGGGEGEGRGGKEKLGGLMHDSRTWLDGPWLGAPTCPTSVPIHLTHFHVLDTN